jgi:hypothetical protein
LNQILSRKLTSETNLPQDLVSLENGGEFYSFQMQWNSLSLAGDEGEVCSSDCFRTVLRDGVESRLKSFTHTRENFTDKLKLLRLVPQAIKEHVAQDSLGRIDGASPLQQAIEHLEGLET